MNKKSTTKDELFLLKLYEMALALGSPEEDVDRYAIGRAIGQNDHGIDTIIKHLAQANFIKKNGESALHLTPHGIKLVEQLRKERLS
jgi:hypothetical protein